MSLNRVVVMGLGKVGSLVGTLLHDSGFKVTGLDAVPREGLPFETRVANLTDPEALRPFLQGADAVVSCLPFHLNIALSREAHAVGIHYFDLTEDVGTTQQIRELAKSSRGLMAPQCGLAPGFIGIVGADLAKKFDRLRSIELKVGALPKHPRGKLGYAFNWSPEGVINEYINDCEVIRMGHRQMVPALEVSMAAANSMLRKGLINQAEYDCFNRLMAEKHRPPIGDLLLKSSVDKHRKSS